MPTREPLPTTVANRPFSVRESERLGVSPGRLRSRDLSTPYRGVRQSTDIVEIDDPLHDCRAYSLRMRPGEFFWGVTAARIWGAPLPPGEWVPRLHVGIPAPRRATRHPGVTGHQVARPRHKPLIHEGLPVSDPGSTWLALTSFREMRAGDLVAAGDFFIHVPPVKWAQTGRPHVSFEELRDRTAHFHGSGAQRARDAVVRLDAAAESRPESLLRVLLDDHGLPAPLVNPSIIDSGGLLIGRVDLAFPTFRVVVEYDGDQHRTDDRQYEKDMTRLERLTLDGWKVIRVRKHGLFRDQLSTVARVRGALGPLPNPSRI